MARMFAGLDVSQEMTSICVVDGAGTRIFETDVETTPARIAAALKPYRRALEKVGHETGSFTPWLHKELLRRRFRVVCLDARQTRAALAAQRNKTDRNDARDIAIALSRGFDGRAFVKSDEAHRLRLLLTYRRVLKRKARDLEQAIRMSVRVFGARIERKGQNLVLTSESQLDATVADLNASMLRARDEVLAEVKAMDRLVMEKVKADSVCRRLMTAPGVGPITALTFRAAVDDPSRFASSRLVGAHFGLTPKRFQSGKADFSGHISRCGDKEVRTVLYEAAMTMLTHTKKHSRLLAWGQRLRKEKGFKFAAVACARKLAVILHRMWVTETDFRFDSAGS